MRGIPIFLFLALIIAVLACKPSGDNEQEQDKQEAAEVVAGINIDEKVEDYAPVELNADLSHLSGDQKKLTGKLIEVSKIMDDIFWKEAFGNKQELLGRIDDTALKQFAKINYGPWDRLNGNKPFIKGYDEKPAGAQFYPADMTKQEFKNFESEAKDDLYTLVRRNEEGNLYTIPYSKAFDEQHKEAAKLLREAAELADSEGFSEYLDLRAEALLSDEYFESDMAWMDMKENDLDFVVGPIENYEDGLFNYKTAHEAFVLIKDQEWSQKLNHYASFLPKLQESLPVPEKYKQEEPGSDSDLGAYQVVYYAGDCNAGSKTIAINLPNDPEVRAKKGSRKLQLKNAIRAKFDKILVPISKEVMDESQRDHIQFQAFFENTMFHEVAHGLGLDNTVNGNGTVRESLEQYYSAIEEGKADIIGLFVITKLNEMGEFEDKSLMDNYVTFMASIFRSIRFGISSSHGKANMMRFNYFRDKEAFVRDPDKGTYKVNFDEMKDAMLSLSEKILKIQGNGDFEAAKNMVEQTGVIHDTLEKDLARINNAGIPKDIRFIQGKSVVGLE